MQALREQQARREPERHDEAAWRDLWVCLGPCVRGMLIFTAVLMALLALPTCS